MENLPKSIRGLVPDATSEKEIEKALRTVAEAADAVVAWTFEGNRPPPVPGSKMAALVQALADWREAEGK